MSMREIDKYGVLKEKLQGICSEHNLTYSIQNRSYPFVMTIKPVGGMDAQQTMMEGMEDPGDTGYISPSASMVFTYRDGDLIHRFSEAWTISEALFNKIKNLFKKMHSLWIQHFFRDVLETSPGMAANVTGDGEPQESATESEDGTGDAFADFMDEAEPAVDDDAADDE